MKDHIRDILALEAAQVIMRQLNERTWHGGDTQRTAAIQCIVRNAINATVAHCDMVRP